MKAKKKLQLFLWIGAFSFLISGLSIVLIPVLNHTQSDFLRYLPGGLFWLGLILGAISEVLQSVVSRPLQKKSNKRQLPGVIRFGSNLEAWIATGVFVVGALLLVADAFLQYLHPTMAYCIISAALLGLYGHCIADGVHYSCYKKLKEEVDHE